MKKTTNKVVVILLIMMLVCPGIQALDNAGAFIEKGLSPRGSAMGRSYVCLASASDAVYWNPAGLANSDAGFEIKGMGTTAYETHYTSLQASTGYLGLDWGFAYIGANVEGIDETVENQSTSRGQRTGNSLAYNASAYYLSTAKEVWEGLSIGITGKLIKEQAAQYQAQGIGMDAGALYQPLDWISFGFNLQNIVSPRMEWDTPSKSVDTVPLNIKTGVLFRLLNENLLAGIDLNIRHNRDTKLNFGLEYWLIPNFALRGGLCQEGLSLGTGLNLSGFMLDFSWIKPELEQMTEIYRVSVGYRFRNVVLNK
ncbi:PorV/PorQ family protein [Candidatus Margulisiibacteriota bacterium]